MLMANPPHPASKGKFENLTLLKMNDVISIFYK